MSVHNEGSPLVGRPDIKVKNQTTEFAKKAVITLVALTAVGGLSVLAAHGLMAGVGSDMLVFGGGLSLISGAVYGGLRFGRDRKHGKAVKTEELHRQMSKETDLTSYKKEVSLNGKNYAMEVTKKKKVILKHHK